MIKEVECCYFNHYDKVEELVNKLIEIKIR